MLSPADYQMQATRVAILSSQHAPGYGCKALSHIPVVSNALGSQLLGLKIQNISLHDQETKDTGPN
jgi:hypothetical protein